MQSLMIHAAPGSKISQPLQLLTRSGGRGNFFDDKIPGYRQPGRTAATAFCFTPCRLQQPPSQDLTPSFAF